MKYALSIPHFLCAADIRYMTLSFMSFVVMALQVKLESVIFYLCFYIVQFLYFMYIESNDYQ